MQGLVLNGPILGSYRDYLVHMIGIILRVQLVHVWCPEVPERANPLKSIVVPLSAFPYVHVYADVYVCSYVYTQT